MVAKQLKFIIKIILSVSALGLLIFAFMPERIKVNMVRVSKADLLVTMEGEGKTRIHDIYTVSTPIDGRSTRIESEPGDWGKAGETMPGNIRESR